MRGDLERCVKLWNVQSERKICSADEITFKTEDPETLPLPSWELLDMHWVLQRMSALAGAAEVEDDIESDDGEGNSDNESQEWMDDCDSRRTERSSSSSLSQYLLPP